MTTLGILALQGAFLEHKQMLSLLGYNAYEVRDIETLNSVDGIIIPGGESTTMSKLLKDFHLLEPLKQKIEQGLPVLGTCAGMILLAKKVINDSMQTLDVMSIKVKRNAYGRQLDSFCNNSVIPKISPKPIQQVFIRAPYITEVSHDVEVLHQIDEHIVAVKEKNMLATSFHPELTNDPTVHDYFIQMIKK